MANPDEVAAGRPVVLRGGTVLTMDDSHTILAEADVLVTGDRIAPRGPPPAGHAEGAIDGLRAVPGRFVLAYGNIQAGPWEWTADPAFRSFFDRRPASDMLGFQIAFDVTGDPSFPEKAAFEAARELGLPV